MNSHHDPLCPTNQNDDPACWFCDLLARVRADERATAQVQACDAHISRVRWADAVAAKLVEVICEDVAVIVELDTAHDLACEQRDAARAEVAALRAAVRDEGAS